MDKLDFIDKIISLYPHAIRDRETQYDAYKRALSATNIDFERLYDVYCRTYSDAFPPPPAWLHEQSLKCRKAQELGHQEMKTITAVDLNGVYEFVCEADYDINKLSKKFLLFWEGGYYSCPADKKPLLEQLTKAQREKITGRKTA